MSVNSLILGGIGLIAYIFYNIRKTEIVDEAPTDTDKPVIVNTRFTGQRIRRSRKYWPSD